MRCTQSTADISVDQNVISDAARTSIELVATKCAICGVDDCYPIAVGEDFEYRTSPDEYLAVRCRECSLVYLNPRPSEKYLQQIYPDTYHAFDFEPQKFGIVFRVRGWLESRRLLRWCRRLGDDARILDVGCGDGFHIGLLKTYGRSGWKLEGVDADPRAQLAAERRGIEVRCGRVEDIDLKPGSYDLILMIMTIEHLPDPLKTLRRIYDLLSAGGRVVIVTDNIESPDFHIFCNRHWGGYHFPRHWYLFSRTTLAKLAEKVGFSVEQNATAVSPVNWTYSIRNWIDDWKGPRWLVSLFSLQSPMALAIFTFLDIPLSWIGRGAILQSVFQKSDSHESTVER